MSATPNEASDAEGGAAEDGAADSGAAEDGAADSGATEGGEHRPVRPGLEQSRTIQPPDAGAWSDAEPRPADEMLRQNQYLAALHATTVGMMARLDVADMLESMLNRACRLLDAPHGFVHIADPGETELTCRVGVGAFSRWVGTHLERGEGLAGKVWATGQPFVVDDYDQWQGRSGQFEAGILGAMIGVPLESDGDTVGAIILAHDPGLGLTFGSEELEILTRFAQLASVALDNARLYAAAQEAQRRTADIIDFLPDPTLVIARDGKVIAWNHAIEELTGVKDTDILGKGDHEYAVPFYGERRPILIDLVLLPDQEISARYAAMQTRKGILMGEVWVPQLRGSPAYLFATT